MNREAAIQIAKTHIKKWEQLSSRDPNRNIYFSNPESLPKDTKIYAYPDGRGFSIGWGSYDKLSDGTKVLRGTSITKEKADFELDYELRQMEKSIFPKIKRDMTEVEYAALLDTAYNAGPGSLNYTSNGKGETFPSLLSLANAGKDTTAVFPKVAITDSGSGKVLNSLINRRKDAAALYTGQYNELYSWYLRNAPKVNLAIIGALFLGIGGYLYFLSKKGIIKL